MRVPIYLMLGARLLSAPVASRAATPVYFKVQTVVDSREESLDHPRSYVTVGDRKICFKTPPFCQLTSTADSISANLDKPGRNGQFTVANSPFKPSIDLYGNVDDYVNAARAAIPKEAEEIEFNGGNDRVYVINKWKSNAFDFSYKLHGRINHRQVAYINLDAEHQICITVVSDEESVQETLGMARSFMNSWFWADDLK